MRSPLSSTVTTTNSISDRRGRQGRRRQGGFPPQFGSQRRRRSCGRRKTDRGGYVDIYDRGSWGIAMAVMAMSFLDAVFTVLQIEKGAVREANPLMSIVLTWGGVFAFFGLKACMTAFALAIIILHKEWTLAHYMARLCLWFYILILLYHLFLIWGYTGAAAPFRVPF
jgi:hypothetical protein